MYTSYHIAGLYWRGKIRGLMSYHVFKDRQYTADTRAYTQYKIKLKFKIQIKILSLQEK